MSRTSALIPGFGEGCTTVLGHSDILIDHLRRFCQEESFMARLASGLLQRESGLGLL
jgi:hypothetical protein